MEEVEPDKIWEDLTDKSCRLTMIEEGLEQRGPEVETARACADDEVEGTGEELVRKGVNLEAW